MIVAKRVISQLARNKDICPNDFFLVRDCANRILIATEDRSMTAIIMLNMLSGFNEYKSDIPRLTHELKLIGYEILGIVPITKGCQKFKIVSLADYL